MSAATVLYLSHGGGPLPLLGDAGHAQMVSVLHQLAKEIPRPRAVLMVSAHWEAPCPTVTTAPNPSLIYDYYGFPDAAYHIQYPCPGEPELARQVYDALAQAGWQAGQTAERGFDHGLFVPMKIMYPDADIPCVQVSLLQSLDAEQHIRLGEALRHIHSDNLLVIGSGFSFHNMRAFFEPGDAEANRMNEAFDQWLGDVCMNTGLTEVQRREQLIDWEKAPHARYCHPREEHLLPLQFCYGVAGTAATSVYRCRILNKQASMFLWQPNR